MVAEHQRVRAVQEASLRAFPGQVRSAVVVPSLACIVMEIVAGIPRVALDNWIVDRGPRDVDPSDDVRVHGKPVIPVYRLETVVLEGLLVGAEWVRARARRLLREYENRSAYSQRK